MKAITHEIKCAKRQIVWNTIYAFGRIKQSVHLFCQMNTLQTFAHFWKKLTLPYTNWNMIYSQFIVQLYVVVIWCVKIFTTWKIVIDSTLYHHANLLNSSTKQVNCVGGMAGIEPTPSKSNDWTPLSPCQLGQGGGDSILCTYCFNMMPPKRRISWNEILFNTYSRQNLAHHTILFDCNWVSDHVSQLKGWSVAILVRMEPSLAIARPEYTEKLKMIDDRCSQVQYTWSRIDTL